MNYSIILGREIQGSNWARNHLSASDSSIDERKSISYLKKLFNKLKDKENVDIKDIEKTFKKQLQKDTNLSLEEIDLQLSELSSSGIFEELENALKETQDETSDSTSENDALFEMYELIFQEEEFIKIGDLDESGDLSAQEMEEMILSISNLDGNGENTTLDELLYATKGILEGKSFEEIANSANTELKTDATNDTEKAMGGNSSSKPSTRNSHESNYTEPGGDLVSATTSKEIQAQIKTEQAKIADYVKEKQERYKADEIYTGMLANLDSIKTSINQTKAEIETKTQEMHTLNYDLTALIAQESNMKEPQILGDYKNSGETLTYKEQYDAWLVHYESEKTRLETAINSKQKEIDELNSTLETQIKEEEGLENDIREHEEKNNYSVQDIDNKIKASEDKIKELETKLEELRKQELEDAKVYGKAQACRESEFVKCMLDYAKSPEMKEKYDDWYYQNKQAYCAIFTQDVASYMYKQVASAMGITEAEFEKMYQKAQGNCPKTRGVGSTNFAASVAGTAAWGEEMQAALDQYGIGVNATIDISKMSEQERKDAVRNGKIYPGMAFTYMENGRLHVGFVESINKDMSWNTIEGNTSVKYSDGTSENGTVGTHRRNATFGDLSTMTDPMVKVLWWLAYREEYDPNKYKYA